MKNTVLTILLLTVVTFGFAQSNEQIVLDSTVRHFGLFLHRKPIQPNNAFVHVYTDSLRFCNNTRSREFVPPKAQIQLYTNLIKGDTSTWRATEFPQKVKVSSRSGRITSAKIKKHFSQGQWPQIKKLIHGYNGTREIMREIAYVSRPVFDSTFTYAAVLIDALVGNVGGGGKVLLFHKQRVGWHFVGKWSSWDY
jgi:hypothetical protein